MLFQIDFQIENKPLENPKQTIQGRFKIKLKKYRKRKKGNAYTTPPILVK